MCRVWGWCVDEYRALCVLFSGCIGLVPLVASGCGSGSDDRGNDSRDGGVVGDDGGGGAMADAAGQADAAGRADAAGQTDAALPPECLDGPCPPVTIAGSIDSPYAMAVTPSGDQVFWLTPTEVGGCAVEDCAEPTLMADLEVPFLPDQRRNRMVATDQEVFWIGRGNFEFLMSCPLDGCPLLEPVVKPGHELFFPRSLVMAGPDLLVGQRFEGLLCDPAGGCAFIPCVSADSIQSIVSDETTVYWLEGTDPAGLYSCLLAAPGPPALSLTAERGQVVRLVGDDLYVLRRPGTGIYRCPRTGCDGVGVPLVTDQLEAGSMAVDETGIYWTVPGSDTQPTGEVRSCPLDGCGDEAPRVLAAGQPRPTDITLSGGDIFWVNQGLPDAPSTGAIMRVRRSTSAGRSGP